MADKDQVKERPAPKYQHTYQQLGYSTYKETPKVVKNFRVAVSKIHNQGKDDEDNAKRDQKAKVVLIIAVVAALLYFFVLSPSEDPGAAPAEGAPPAAAPKAE
jgi:hypothetical protein